MVSYDTPGRGMIHMNSAGTAPVAGPEGTVCGHCRQGMRTAASCTPTVLVIGGRRYRRQRGKTIGPDSRCGDCGVRDGGVHHLGCDLEVCPQCGGQLISCSCLDGGFQLAGRRRG